MPNCVLNSQLSVALICGLDASTNATCSKTRKKEKGGEAERGDKAGSGAAEHSVCCV